jgi:hypothetical protein
VVATIDPACGSGDDFSATVSISQSEFPRGSFPPKRAKAGEFVRDFASAAGEFCACRPENRFFVQNSPFLRGEANALSVKTRAERIACRAKLVEFTSIVVEFRFMVRDGCVWQNGAV